MKLRDYIIREGKLALDKRRGLVLHMQSGEIVEFGERAWESNGDVVASFIGAFEEYSEQPFWTVADVSKVESIRWKPLSFRRDSLQK